jgi:hypothetical protein
VKRLAVVIAAATVAVNCSSPPRGPAEPDDWRHVAVGTLGEDAMNVAIAAGSSQILLGASGGRDLPNVWRSSNGVSWDQVALPGLEPFSFVNLFDFEVATDRQVAALGVTTGPLQSPPNSGPFPLIYESRDGRTWRRTLDDDFSGYAMVNKVEATTHGLIAVGDVRSGGEVGPLTPTIWISSKAGEWQKVFRGNRGEYGAPATVVEFKSTLVAPGSVDQKPVVWTSEDGRKWNQQLLPGGFGWASHSAALANRVLVAGHSESGEGMTVWSSDDGSEWKIVAGLRSFGGSPPVPGFPVAEGELRDLVAFHDGVVARVVLAHRTHPAWCYVDIRTCQQTTIELLFSQDGATWEMIGARRHRLPKRIRAAARWRGDLLIVGEEGDRRLGVWFADVLGETTRLQTEATPRLDFELVDWGDQLRPGVRYGYPLYVHCGIEQLGVFNEKAWILEREPAGAPSPETWPTQPDRVYGTLRLTDLNRIEYSIPGGVIAIYRPVDKTRLRECD